MIYIYILILLIIIFLSLELMKNIEKYIDPEPVATTMSLDYAQNVLGMTSDEYGQMFIGSNGSEEEAEEEDEDEDEDEDSSETALPEGKCCPEGKTWNISSGCLPPNGCHPGCSIATAEECERKRAKEESLRRAREIEIKKRESRSRGLIDQNIMINGDILVDSDNDITDKKFASLYIDGSVSLGDESKEVCLQNKCFDYNELNKIVNANLPHFLYNEDTSRDIKTKDYDISEETIAKKLCIGDYCINGEHLKILNDVKTSKLWTPNRRADQMVVNTHPHVYNNEEKPYGTGYINGNLRILTHGGCPNGTCLHDDNDDATIRDVISMATATGYPIGEVGTENDFKFAFIPGKKTNIKCDSFDNYNVFT